MLSIFHDNHIFFLSNVDQEIADFSQINSLKVLLLLENKHLKQLTKTENVTNIFSMTKQLLNLSKES